MLEIYKRRNGYAGRITMAQELRKVGVYICDQTARKLMAELGLKCRLVKTHYNSYGGENNLSPELLHRDFSAKRPGEKLVTDVTMIQCADKPLYLSAVIDLCTREVVGASLTDRPNTEFVIDSVAAALESVDPKLPCIIHSDQGVQYQSAMYRNLLATKPNVIQSMSRKGMCYDNGACESFFGILKRESGIRLSDSFLCNQSKAASFIEYFNKFRCKPSLGGMSPTQYRMSGIWKDQ